jgi:hypothetical protein
MRRARLTGEGFGVLARLRYYGVGQDVEENVL